jgi:predicted PurR-regulated permease PerM
MKDMKLIMENWDKYLNEEQSDAIDVFYQVCEQKEAQRKELLKEVAAADLDIDPNTGMRLSIKPIGKWSALLGMTGIAAYSGLQAIALNVGGAVGVAFFLSTNAVTLAIVGALTYAFFKAKKLLPGWLKNIFPKFSKKQDPLKAAQDKIQMMIKTVKERSDLTQEQAVALLEIVNKEVNENEEHKQIAKDLLKAIDNNDSELVRTLTDKLDDTISKIIQRLQDELKQHMEQTADEEESSRIKDTLPHLGQYLIDKDGRRVYAKGNKS